MTQIATVERILDARHAEISVPRQTACGHDCERCAGCGVTGQSVRARAENLIGAEPGEKVVVHSDTGRMLGIVAAVYLVPVALFLGLYLAAAACTERVGIQYGAAAAGFALGLIPAVWYDRRIRARGGLSMTIVRLF